MAGNKIVDIEKILLDRQFDPDKKPPPEKIVFSIQDHCIGSRGNFICLSGLPKAGKSTFINAIIASSMTQHNLYGMKLNCDGNFAYFDTESSQSDFYKNMQRIRHFAGYVEFPQNFKAYNTRIDPYEFQRAIIEKYIELHRPSVLVIDGFLDLIRNYNDESESRYLMDWLKKTTAEHNMLIIGCIHIGKKDGHTLGHFGSMLDRYAQSVLEIVRDYENDLYLLKPKMLRSAGFFETIALMRTGSDFVQVKAPMDKPKTIKK